MAQVFARVRARAAAEPLLWAYLLLTLLAVAAAAALSTPLPLIVPIGVLGIAIAVLNLRLVLLLCVAAITVSMEVNFGSLGMDLPAEPIMLLLTGLGIIYIVRRAGVIEADFFRHPITLLLLLHLSWILLTTLTSSYQLTSIKYLFAKLWYVVPFYFLAAFLIRRQVDMRRLVLWIAVPLSVVLLWCLVRHAALGFTFEMVNKAMSPFFRNHVSYAALASILVPFFVLSVRSFGKGSLARYWLVATSILALAAVYTSYTRAAFVSLFVGFAFVYIVKWKLTRPALVLAVAVIVAASSFLVSQNRFFGFAPNYTKTVTHKDFSNLLEATYKLEDISTMERVYRWVAGSYMAAEKPWVGWGPGNFHRYYKGFALESFRTYVSENPEKSGIHNYLLMVLVEQGWLGLLIFFSLCVAGLLTAQRAYHRAQTPAERRTVLMLAASLAINLSFQLINDMLETDKSGPWFFLTLALLVNLDLRGRLDQTWDSRDDDQQSIDYSVD